MLVAAASAWSQCTFRTQTDSPPYRTLFSMASLVLTVKAAGLAHALSAAAAGCSHFSWIEIPKPLVGAATTYFVCNTALVATAIGLSTKEPIAPVWNENFLWSAPSYFVGGRAALPRPRSSIAAATGWRRSPSAPSISPTAPTRCTWGASRTSSATCSRCRTSIWPPSKRWRSPSTRRIRRRRATSAACRCTRRASRGRSG